MRDYPFLQEAPMIGTPEFDAFVSDHRWAVVTTLRKDGSASSSMNAYARDGDDLVISTQAHRLKTRTLDNDPRITVCVISNKEPFNFVSVEGRAQVQREDITEATSSAASPPSATRSLRTWSSG
jgi:PPOX class probable F420-dependent enzyme